MNHIAWHGVTPEEAEAVFVDPVVLRTRSGRYLALGQTMAGRYLTVVFELRAGRVAREEGLPYQTLIRMWVVEGIRREKERAG